jgi:hypothetical protein
VGQGQSTATDDAQLDELVALLPEEEAPKKPLPRAKQGAESSAYKKKSDELTDELLQLFPVDDPGTIEQIGVGAAGALADLAKAPELLGKFAVRMGVKKETLERHFPDLVEAAKGLSAAGDDLRAWAADVEDPRFADQGLGSQLARGAGSMIPFVASGAAGTAFGFGARGGSMLVALTGAAQTAVPMYEDVLAETGDEDKAWAAAALGLGLGATEALGVGKVFAKLDRASAGTFRKALARVAIEGGEEAIQEWVQTFGQSVGTKALSGKEIKYLQEVAEANQGAAVGAILGGMVSGGHEGLAAGLERIARPRAPGAAPTDVAKPKARMTEDEREASISGLGRSVLEEAGGADFLGPPAGLLGPEDVQPPAAGEPASRGVPAAVPEAAAGGGSSKEGPATEEEAVAAILRGEDLELEDLQKFPKAIGKAARAAQAPEAEPEERRRADVAPAKAGRARTREADVEDALRRVADAYRAPEGQPLDAMFEEGDLELGTALQNARAVLAARRDAGIEPTARDEALETLLKETADVDFDRQGAEFEAAHKRLKDALKGAEQALEAPAPEEAEPRESWEALRSDKPAVSVDVDEKGKRRVPAPPKITPEAKGPGAGEGQPSAEEAVQQPAGTAQASGVSSDAPAEAAPKKPKTKEDEEEVERGSVVMARDVVRSARERGAGAHEVFELLLARHQTLPSQKARTSTSKEMQAFSTPTPLAWVASRLAGIEPGTKVYEPTAGNGALLIDADTGSSQANELQESRAVALEALGFSTTREDAAENAPPEGSADVVIANPPFGKVKDDQGNFRSWPAGPDDSGRFSWRTREIDRAIAMRALRTMKDDGRAVLLIGGKKPFGDNSQEARTKQYRSLEDQRFFRAIYDTYNVTKHVTVAGKLYDRMGAAWPIDLIVIEGRKPTPTEVSRPFAAAPPILESWNDVRDLIPDERLAPGREPEADRGAAPGPAEPVAEPVGGPARAAAGEGGEAPRGERRAKPARRVEEPGGGAAEDAAGAGVGAVPAARSEPAPVGRGGPGGLAEAGSADAGGVEGARRDRPTRVARPAAAEPARGLERVGEFQATYQPKSKGKAVGTLVPANMQTSIDRALARIEQESGGVDKYVAKKLGYSQKALGEHFSAEQVDALALAITNLDEGAGFIIGDQTGVGKGRVVAGILRYAKRLGRIPVFVTAKPGLYADMRRDLADIGMPEFNAFITNTNLRGQDKIVLKNGEVIESLPPAKHAAAMKAIQESEKPTVDAVFTTYDQLNPRGGAETARAGFLRSIAPKSILVLDESHKAGGTESSGFFKDKEGNAAEKASRAQTFRDLVDAAAGVVYSSATYAKNPHVMTLYSRTDMGLAANREKLPELMRAGGVPLQQVVASMLTERGQMMRREKSFEGISMALEQAASSRESADRATDLIGKLFAFDLQMKEVRDDFTKANAAGGGGVNAGDSAVGAGGGKSGGFSSVLHNVIAQMLLSLKAKDVGRRAVAMFKGEAIGPDGKKLSPRKPLVALTNTLEGLLADTVTDTGAKVGDEIKDFTFGKILDRYLERTRQVTIKTPFSKDKGQKMRIPDEDMGHLAGEFDALKELIAGTDLSELPASPIDAIIHEMEKGGLKVGEITGRHLRVAYDSEGRALLAERKSSDAFKKKAMLEFNDGELDALIINESGAQGYSLHAAPDNGNDLRPRHMYVVQGDPNIDTFMQMLGRINRTGQTSLPSYTVLVADLPSEKRPAAILMKKMASLNANTSASRGSAVSLKNVVDFMNVYGDRAVADILDGEPDIAAAIGLEDKKIEAELEAENLARRVTGLLPILPIDRQAEILDQIEANYTSRIDEANASGENLLEAQALDLKAKTLSSTEVVPGTGESPFTQPAVLQEVEASRYAKPLNWETIQARARRMAGVEGGADVIEAGRKQAAEFDKRITDALEEERTKEAAAYKETEKLLQENPDKAEAIKAKLDAIKNRFAKKHLLSQAIRDRVELLLNRSVTLETNEDTIPAYVVGIEAPAKGNLLAPSRWSIVVAPADADLTLKLPISRLMTRARGEEGYLAIAPARHELGPEDFAGEATEKREKRWIVTGNLLAGFQKFDGKGQIVFYTDETGAQNQGILLKRGANPMGMLAGKPVAVTPDQALEFLDKNGGFVESDDGFFRVSSRGSGFPIHFVAKTKGGKAYYLHKGARSALGDYVSRRGKAEWEAFTEDRKAAKRALEAYASDLGTALQVTQGKDKAREITGEKVPELTGEGPPTDIREAMAFPGQLVTGEEVRSALDAIARKLGYIRNQKALEAGVIPTETWKERQIRKFQDSFRGVKKAQEAVGGELEDDLDAYLAEELRRGRTKARLEKTKATYWDPMLSDLRKAGISPEEAGEVLMARAAPDRNRIILERDPENEAGSGMTDDEAAEILDAALAGKRAAGFERLFERFDEMIAATRQGWVDDGMKTQKEVDELAKEQPFYAPLRSDLDDVEARGTLGTGRGVDVRTRAFRKATGRHTRAEAANVLAYAFTQAEQAAIVGEKTRVVRSFGNFIRANEESLKDFAEVGPTLSKPVVGKDNKVRWTHDRSALHADNVVAFWEDGKLVPIKIDRRYQNVADALKNLGSDNIGHVLGFIRQVNRWIVATNLTYNPVFPLGNAIRDAASAFIHSNEHGLGFAVRTIRDVPAALWALSKHKLGKGGGAKWDAYVREYHESGAPVAFLDILGFNQHLKTIERDARAELRPGTLGMTIRGLRSLLAAIREANGVVENGVRLSAYIHAREDLGMTPERAASWSKNLTVNFERKGDFGATINTLYLFSNAGIQSTARVAQALRHPAVRRLLAAGFMGLMAWDQIQRALGGKDDDGEDFWDKIPAWQKRHNLIFMLPGERGRYITIPAPFVYDLVQTMALQLSGAMSGDVKAGDALGEIVSAGAEAFDPIGSGQVTLDDPSSFARLLSPTFSDPLVELATNRDWKGSLISPTKWKEREPDSENFWPSASHASVAAARWMNKVSGGDEFEAGGVDVSPETLEHWTKFMAGGLGRIFSQTLELTFGEDIQPRDVPFLSKFLSEIDTQRASTDDFKKLHDGLSAERDRAKRDKKMLPAELFGLWKAGNKLDDRRAAERKRIEGLKGEERKKAERALAKELQEWSARARKALLQTHQ